MIKSEIVGTPGATFVAGEHLVLMNSDYLHSLWSEQTTLLFQASVRMYE